MSQSLSSETEEDIIDAQLVAMGANPNEGYYPKPVKLPKQIELSSRLQPEVPILRSLPPPLMDRKEATDNWNELQAKIDEKKGEYDSYLGEYTLLSALYKQAKQPLELQRQCSITEGRIHKLYLAIAGLQRDIFMLQRSQAGITNGKRLVNAEEWWLEYDSLWERKLAIQHIIFNKKS